MTIALGEPSERMRLLPKAMRPRPCFEFPISALYQRRTGFVAASRCRVSMMLGVGTEMP